MNNLQRAKEEKRDRHVENRHVEWAKVFLEDQERIGEKYVTKLQALASLLASVEMRTKSDLMKEVGEILKRPCGHANGPDCVDCRDKSEALSAVQSKQREYLGEV